ncbi:hypothetical protein [Lactobacillus crispatus]|jgi:hypothetical protein|uniref:Uncharacterized protein n=1 Tax=Lactobacillus crispatus TaxID=47770 RepID=A0A135Z8J4_9LACO|nr:hypothetical protein [Lactobacillus crispatus]KWU08866.1 hypothetical protein AEL98_08855 [Lactobacillus crispatus]KWU14549.1 hypothetical protein AEM00_06960 [Lactobacillus crispatus]KXI17942.1 hypothetical protein HMPREF3209_01259 [Lactobacillus crispatus]MCT7696767.1 hypothetical protein [Lactobacillus crispatus]MCT7708241.1 hypothetical protein [Lactobacillus crispatus]
MKDDKDDMITLEEFAEAAKKQRTLTEWILELSIYLQSFQGFCLQRWFLLNSDLTDEEFRKLLIVLIQENESLILQKWALMQGERSNLYQNNIPWDVVVDAQKTTYAEFKKLDIDVLKKHNIGLSYEKFTELLKTDLGYEERLCFQMLHNNKELRIPTNVIVGSQELTHQEFMSLDPKVLEENRIRQNDDDYKKLMIMNTKKYIFFAEEVLKGTAW